MQRLPKQVPLPLTRKDRVVGRQIRQRAAGLKVGRGPGRPRKPGSISHKQRPVLGRGSVLHVTVKLRRGLPRLRGRKPFGAVAAAFSKFAHGDGFRLVHFSVQHDHLHLLVEADSKPKLSRGMQKLLISIARRLNILWGHGQWLGRIFRERYHAHHLETPREVRHALTYVLHNSVKHSETPPGIADPFSSAAFFTGYKTPPELTEPPLLAASTLARGISWLLNVGWKRHGRLRPDERPTSVR